MPLNCSLFLFAVKLKFSMLPKISCRLEVTLIYRIVRFDISFGVVWLFLGLFQFMTYNLTYYYRSFFHVNLFFAWFAVISGIIVGVFAVGWWTTRTLRTIEKKGVFSVSSTFLLAIIATGIIAIIFIGWIGLSSNLQVLIISFDFLYPLPATVFLTRGLLYWRWQRKNKRLIYCHSEFFIREIYPYPYIFNTPPAPSGQTM